MSVAPVWLLKITHLPGHSRGAAGVFAAELDLSTSALLAGALSGLLSSGLHPALSRAIEQRGTVLSFRCRDDLEAAEEEAEEMGAACRRVRPRNPKP